MSEDQEFDQDEQSILDALARVLPIEPAGDIRDRFRDRAETERIVGTAPRRWITVALAAALVLTLGGAWWFDRSHEAREVETLRAELAGLPVTARYERITAAGDSGVNNSRIVAALTASLLTDPSTNVRVAAAEALGRIAAPAALRDAAVKSIRSDSSPFVQTAWLTATARLSAADRTAVLRALLSRPDLDPVVRAEAEQRAKS